MGGIMRALNSLRLINSMTLAASFSLFGCGVSENVSTTEGLFQTKAIGEAYFLDLDLEKDFFRFKDYVEAHAGRRDPTMPIPSYTSLDIAYDIFMVSHEMGVDPRVLLALVRKESSYRADAVSPTGAVGLTQFTGLGINEVKDQLGARGTSYALSSTINYWQELVPRVYKQLSSDKDLELPQADTTVSSVKEMLVDDPLLAIIYGALLLKTNLAVVKEKNAAANPPLSMRDLYRKALENYNGDPPVKEEYAKTILLWAESYR